MSASGAPCVLPDDVLVLVFFFLNAATLRSVAASSRAFQRAARYAATMRNHIFYKFLQREVLSKFSPEYWTVTGLAALWLLKFKRKEEDLYWLPDRVNIFYVGARHNTHPYQLDSWLDPNAQPAYVKPFKPEDECSAFPRDESEYNDGLAAFSQFFDAGLAPIHVYMYPCHATRANGAIGLAFYFTFVNIAAHRDDSKPGAVVFYLSVPRKWRYTPQTDIDVAVKRLVGVLGRAEFNRLLGVSYSNSSFSMV